MRMTMPIKHPPAKSAKMAPARPFENTAAGRYYYRKTWGFDPVAGRINLGKGRHRYEAWYPMVGDPGLVAVGMEVGARVDWERGGPVRNCIVFRRGQVTAEATCAKEAPAGPDASSPAETFAARKSFVAMFARAGIGKMLRVAWDFILRRETRSTGAPLAVDSQVQAEVIRALQDVAMPAWEGILTDWIAELLDNKTPAELGAMQDPLNQMLKWADFEKFFRDAHIPPEAEDEERNDWEMEPTGEGPLGERLAYRGHPIGLARALELLWQRADHDWWVAHREQIETLFGMQGEVVEKSFAPVAVIRSTGERVLAEEGGNLDLRKRGITTLADVDFSGCKGDVKKLYLHHNEIQKIENLGQLVGLEELYLDENKIAVIENLDCIAQTLKIVSFDANNLHKIEGLGALTFLKILYLNGNKITHIEGLDGLNNLEQLSLAGNLITKIENIDYLPALRNLALDNNLITKIEHLDPLRNLIKLSMDGNQIDKIEGFDNLLLLQNLSLEFNHIGKIEGLDSLKNLKSLFLKGNLVSKIERIESLPQLENLYISNNQLHSIIGINAMPQLKVCDAKENEINEIPDISNNNTLTTLWLSKNKIVSIPQTLPNLSLQSLHLDGNLIGNITNLPTDFPNINSIDLSGNPIQDLNPLGKLQMLQNLVLCEMKLNDLNPLTHLKHLTTLTLDKSIISSLAPCAKLPNLKWVNLRGTRVSDLENREEEFLLGLKRPDGSLPLDVIGWRAYYKDPV